MDPIKVRGSKGPEEIIQDAIEAFLRLRGWHVMPTHGNQFQSGFPDIYAFHQMYKQRWVEVKNPKSYKFTQAQLEHFPKMGNVWILVEATEAEYAKLFKPPNWHHYLGCVK